MFEEWKIGAQNKKVPTSTIGKHGILSIRICIYQQKNVFWIEKQNKIKNKISTSTHGGMVDWLVGANSTLICFLLSNKQYKSCTQMHLIFILYVIPNNSSLFQTIFTIHFIIVIVSSLPRFWNIIDNLLSYLDYYD